MTPWEFGYPNVVIGFDQDKTSIYFNVAAKKLD